MRYVVLHPDCRRSHCYLLVLTVKYALLVNKLFITNTECVHREVRAEAEERVEQQNIIQHNTIRRRHYGTCEVRAEAEERIEQQTYNTT